MLHFGHGRLVGSQHTVAKPLAQLGAQGGGSLFHDGVLTVLQVDGSQARIGRIAELLSLGNEGAVESGIVVVHHLADDGHILLLGLQDDQSALLLAACPSADLRHHHEGVLVGTEVGHVEHGVGTDDAYHRDVVEVKTLRDHLRANQDIGAPSPEVGDDALVGIAGAGGVQVHAGDAGIGERLAHLLLYLLRAVAVGAQVGGATAGTLRGYLIGGSAVVAGQLVQLPVQCQLDVAVVARGHPAALVALYLGRKATAVLEEDGLFATLQGLAYTC